MAVDVGSIVVRLQADLSALKAGLEEGKKDVKSFSDRTKGLADDLKIGIVALGAAAVAVAVQSVRAFSEQEKAVNQLSIALKNQGITSKAAIKDMTEYASSIQATTAFADEDVLALQARLVQFGLTGDKLKEVTKRTLDLSVASGRDLATAGEAVGKAYAGQVEGLGRLGIKIDDNIPKTKAFDMAMEKIAKTMGGMAEGELNTTEGQFKNLGNQINDLEESLGEMLVGPATQLITWLRDVVKWVADTSRPFMQMIRDMGGVGNTIKVVLLQSLQDVIDLFQKIPGAGKLLKLVGIDVKALSGVIQDEIQTVEDKQFNSDAAIKKGSDEVKERMIYNAQSTTKTLQTESDRRKRLMREQATYEADVTSKSNKSREESERKFNETAEGMERQRVNDYATGFEQIASFGQQMHVALITQSMAWSTMAVNAIVQVKDNFAAGMADMIVHGGSFAEMMKKVFDDLLVYIVENIIKKMLAEWLMAMGVMQATGGTGTGAGLFGLAGLLSGGGQAAAGGATAGVVGGSVAPMVGLLGIGAGLAGGSYAGGHLYGENSSQAGANIGAGVGTGIGMLLGGPLGAALGGLAGGAIGGGAHGIGVNLQNLGKGIAGGVHSVGKKIKKVFSGGILGEPSVITGLHSGAQALAGEKGPEALVSFEDDLGINPAEARNRLIGMRGGGGPGGDINITISGTFLEGNPAKWQRLVRDALVPEIRRYVMVSPTGNFNRKRGQS